MYDNWLFFPPPFSPKKKEIRKQREWISKTSFKFFFVIHLIFTHKCFLVFNTYVYYFWKIVFPTFLFLTNLTHTKLWHILCIKKITATNLNIKYRFRASSFLFQYLPFYVKRKQLIAFKRTKSLFLSIIYFIWLFYLAMYICIYLSIPTYICLYIKSNLSKTVHLSVYLSNYLPSIYLSFNEDITSSKLYLEISN